MVLNSSRRSVSAGFPPEELVPKVERIIHLVDTLRAERKDTSLPDRPRTITIVGGRGQGKSTMLAFAVDALRQCGHLVLPIVDPERFSPGDSLLGWVLAELQEELPVEILDAETDQGVTISRLLDDLRKGSALISSDYTAGLARRGVTPSEYARDASRIPAEGAGLTGRWASLIEAVAIATGKEDELSVIVPVDDADLHPSLLAPILGDSQLIGSSQRVVILFAADEATLRQALTVSSVSEQVGAQQLVLQHGLLHVREVRELVERRMVKHFPRSLRVSIPAVSAAGKMAYRPLDRKLTLGELLRQFPVPRAGIATLEDLFVTKTVSGKVVGTSEYTECISDNRRDLRQLYEKLEHIDRTRFGATSQAFTAILEHRLTLGFEVTPGGPQAIEFGSDEEAPSGGLRTVSLSLENMRFGRIVGSGHAVYRADLEAESAFAVRALYVRDIARHYGVIELDPVPAAGPENRPDEASEGTSTPQRVQAPSPLVHLILLAWEGVQFQDTGGELVRLEALTGRISTPGMSNWTNQVHALPYRSGGWHYWMVPDWECYSDYFTFAAGWNRVRPLCVPRPGKLDDPSYLEFLFLTHFDLVVTVQLLHRIPDGTGSLTADELVGMMDADRWPSLRADYLEELADKFRQAVGAAFRATDQRSIDFMTWAGVGLPMMAVRTAATPELSRWLLNLWLSTVELDEFRHSAADYLTEEIGKHVAEARVDAEIDVLQVLDPDTARRLRDLRAVLGRQRDAEREQLIRELDENGVSDELQQRLRRDGATPEILASLMLMSFSPQSLAEISRVFPRTPVASDVLSTESAPSRLIGEGGEVG